MRARLTCLVSAIGLLSVRTVAAKTELLKTSAGSPVHWSRAEITVGIEAALPSRHVQHDGVVAATQAAVDAWNKVPGGQPRFRYLAEGIPDVSVAFCRGRWQGDTIDLGNSRFTASLHDGTVTSAQVTLNECDHVFHAPSVSVQDGLDLQAVLTHELGHVLGLGHSTSPATVMYPSGGGATSYTPTSDDETALALIYFGRSQPAASTAALKNRRAENTAPTLAKLAESATSNAGGVAGAEQTPPADSVSRLSLTANDGRQVMIYTCEPTLLPPMATAPTAREPKRAPGHHARTSAR
jgi:predicted Zn-dependent protease